MQERVLALDQAQQTWNAAPFTYIRPAGSKPLQVEEIFSTSVFSPPAADSDVVWLNEKAPGYWLKLRVRSRTKDGHFILSTKWPSYWDWIGFTSFAFFERQNDGNTLFTKYQTVSNGILTKEFNKTTPFALAFFLRNNQEKTFFIHLSGQDQPLPLVVKTADQYVQNLRGQNFVYSIYFGIIVSLIIFALAMSITMREFRFVWIVIYALTELMLSLVATGVVVLFCNQTNLLLWNAVYYVLLGLIAVTSGLLAIKFHDLKTNAPRWHLIFIFYMVFSFLLALGCIWINKQYFYPYCLFFVFLLTLGPAFALATCIGIAKRTQTKNGFFLAAWSVWTFSGTMDFLTYADIIPYSPVTAYHVLLLCSAMTGLLLMLALSERVNALRRANDVARATNRAKNTFIAKVSHEIRTPMNAIIGLTELVLDSPLTSEQRDQLCTVRQCGEHLLDVVNDVLDFSKAEANKLKLDIQHFDLHQLVRGTLKGLSVLATAKNIELHWQETENVPRFVQGDPQRLRQILVNLAGNAIKFTDQGRVNVRVERIADQDKRIQLHFTVSDTGMGIPAEHLSHIFEDYAQAHIRSGSEGTGLGLSICKELVKLMGGSIQARSAPRKGSVFSFTIFLDPGLEENVRQGRHSQPLLQGAPGLRVLIADDNLINVKVAVAHLSRLGYATAAVGDGQEALEALSKATFDIVLMDLEMPRMNGIEAIRRIRAGQDGVRNPNIPIIVLTAYSLTDAQEQCQGVAVNDFMLKPISFHELASRINKLLYPSDLPSGSAAPPQTTASQRREHPVLDSETARLRLALDEDSYQNILMLSLEELRGLKKQLLVQHSANELFAPSEIRNTVHTIKSTAATMGAVELQHAAMDLEQKMLRNTPKNLEQEMQPLMRAINTLIEQYGLQKSIPGDID